MDKAQVNIYLDTSTRDQLDMLVTATRKQTGQETSRTTIITVLVKEAAARLEAQGDSRKLITMIRNAKGKPTGWRAIYDGHTVGDFDLSDKAGAQLALDRFVYEELSK